MGVQTIRAETYEPFSAQSPVLRRGGAKAPDKTGGRVPIQDSSVPLFEGGGCYEKECPVGRLNSQHV